MLFYVDEPSNPSAGLIRKIVPGMHWERIMNAKKVVLGYYLRILFY